MYTKKIYTPVWGISSTECMGCACGTRLSDTHTNSSEPENITYVRTKPQNQTQMGLRESEC